MLRRCVCLCFLVFAVTSFADGPGDNVPGTVRRIPKLGIDVPADRKAASTTELDQLATAIDTLAKKMDPKTQRLLPDVRIYYKAVHDALKYQEFFVDKELDVAAELLKEGRERAAQLAKGESPWTTATGLVVRGYVSKIDGSVQPYGLVIPPGYRPEQKVRVDLWFHGRGENLSEVNFLQDRRKNKGTFTPEDTIVLHPYGRYCNAAKFAGEIDALEALDSVKAHYRVDEDRVTVRGFSMGGASAWQFAVHYPTRWAAANPGAGFSETPDFLRTFQGETLDPPAWERKLYRWYDCTDWAINLNHCPTVAYSGDQDKQKQAADIMERALAAEGIELVHVIGENTKHAYEPRARDQVQTLLTQLVDKGRQRSRSVHFQTYTLRYNECGWITVDGLGEHWEPARVDGRIGGHNNAVVTTKNVTAMTMQFAAGDAPWEGGSKVQVVLDEQELVASPARSDRGWKCSFHRDGKTWKVGPTPAALRKKPGLQGPIDDAFLDAFVFVRPTGEFANDAVAQWTKSELERAIEHWRRQMRGEARVIDDTAVTEEDIRTKNLVFWGNPSANRALAKIADKLPVRESGGQVRVGDNNYAADSHVPILIYPNPLNPQRYVVLNSSFTYRDYDYLNNARQTPKLPDWAVVDIRTPPNSRWPGKVVEAGFFDEAWQLKSK